MPPKTAVVETAPPADQEPSAVTVAEEVDIEAAETRAILRTLAHMGETVIAVSEWDLARDLQARGLVELRRRDMRDWTWKVTAAGRQFVEAGLRRTLSHTSSRHPSATLRSRCRRRTSGGT